MPLPVKRQNPFTGQTETVYTHIRGELDEPTLNAIADTTGGRVLPRDRRARPRAACCSRIDALEKTRLTSPKREQIDELYAIRSPPGWRCSRSRCSRARRSG